MLPLGSGVTCSPVTTLLLVLVPGGSQVMRLNVDDLPNVSLSTLVSVGGTTLTLITLYTYRLLSFWTMNVSPFSSRFSSTKANLYLPLFRILLLEWPNIAPLPFSPGSDVVA